MTWLDGLVDQVGVWGGAGGLTIALIAIVWTYSYRIRAHVVLIEDDDVVCCDVFVSYDRRDVSIVLPIAEELQAAGLDIYIDPYNGGSKNSTWGPEIESAIENASCCIIFYGCASMSRAQRKQSELALKYHQSRDSYLLIPVVLLGAKPPKGLSDSITEIIFESSDDESARRRLLSMVRDYFSLDSQIIQVRSRDWLEDYRSHRSQRHHPDLCWFTPLSVQMPGTVADQPKLYRNLLSLLGKTEAPILLLGEPGSGKTALLTELERYLHQHPLDGPEAVGHHSRLIPILFSLNTYRSSHSVSESEDKNLLGWLNETWKLDLAPNDLQVPELSHLLSEGRVLLLLDAFDEMTYADAQTRWVELTHFIENLPVGNRVVVSCRARSVRRGLYAAHAYVQPVNIDDIFTWLQKVLRDSHLGDKSLEQCDVAFRDPAIRELYQNPYCLGLLPSLLDKDGVVPLDHAALHNRLLQVQLRREQSKTDTWPRIDSLLSDTDRHWLHNMSRVPVPSVAKQGVLLPALGQLAFSMAKDGLGTILTKTEAETLLQQALHPKTSATSLSIVETPVARDILRAAEMLQIVQQQMVHGVQHWRFSHQRMQEYFAARAWVIEQPTNFERARRPYKADDPQHTDTWQVLVEQLKPGEQLANRRYTGWEETAEMALSLAGEGHGFVRGFAQVDPIQVAQWGFVQKHGYELLKTDLGKKLVGFMHDASIDLRARIDAAMALDSPTYLGFEQRVSSEGHACFLPPMLKIPAGSHLLGSAREQAVWDNEVPEHVVMFELPVWVSRYPVTRAEYQCFFEAGGYTDMRWWPEGTHRRSWLDGDLLDSGVLTSARMVRDWDIQTWERNIKEFPEVSKKHWTRLREMETELEAARYLDAVLRVEDLQSWSETMFMQKAQHLAWGLSEVREFQQLRSERPENAVLAIVGSKLFDLLHPARMGVPRHWHRDDLVGALKPVVGVSLYEAQAYVSWLSWVTQRAYRLPTEQEWEAAARGDKAYIWAFGNEFRPRSCNTLEGGQMKPTPIGVYVAGQTAGTVHDMSGNIWEWTTSPWRDDHRSKFKEDEARIVVRGGSWKESKDSARSACRRWACATDQFDCVGFRIFSSEDSLPPDVS